MVYDAKQRRLIHSWMEFAGEQGRDKYAQFISLWIAFNAACYARYATNANRNRADLRIDTGLALATPRPLPAHGEIVHDGARVKIQLTDPGKIVIIIAKRYTEEIIFEQFARDHQSAYRKWLSERSFAEAVAVFEDAIRKPNGKCYVINMARVHEHMAEDYDRLQSTNVIAVFEDRGNLRQLKNALYQVRCNIFHGEKVPGELNDDRVTQAAFPVLRRIVEALLD